MASTPVSDLREPLVDPPRGTGEVTEDIVREVFRKPGPAWWVGFIVAATTFLVGAYAMGYEMWHGIGVWGLNKTVGWGFAITDRKSHV